MKRIEIMINSYDEKRDLLVILASKGWKTWIVEREGTYLCKKQVVCVEVPDDIVFDI